MFNYFKKPDPTSDHILAQNLRESLESFQDAYTSCESAGLDVTIWYRKYGDLTLIRPENIERPKVYRRQTETY